MYIYRSGYDIKAQKIPILHMICFDRDRNNPLRVLRLYQIVLQM